MRKLSCEEIIRRIQEGLTFEAESSDAGFRISINEYVPYVCTAIHDGHRFRDELKIKTRLSEFERWYEEDPYTGAFISSMPIKLIGLDSRFEYDLNREPETCVYDEAWGKKVWKRALTKAERERSRKKHDAYYRVTYALIAKLEELFGACVVYDMHSYNWRRWDREVPVWNIGSERIDNDRFGICVEKWRDQLADIELPNGIPQSAAINDTFFGRGYNLAFITKSFDNTLVLATEVSKIYCNEETAEPFPAVINSIKGQLKRAILNHAHDFAREFTTWEHKKQGRLLSNDLQESILEVDSALHDLLKNFELLSMVNPINVAQEKKRFFESRCTINPQFEYKPIGFDPFHLKRKIHRLEIEKITDVHIQRLYQDVINAFSDKIDMLSSIGSSKFLYNSMRYFGEPSEKDLKNAWFLQHLPEVEVATAEPRLGVPEAVELFKESFEEYGFKGKIEVSRNMVADAMVINHQKKVMIKKGATFRPKELRFLVHHEIGVHMVTTMNSNLQPLKVFNLGFPVNTMTQEGLAVLSEYLSGNITLRRLKELGQRVIATDMMVKGADFKKTYRTMVNDLEMDVDEAFYLVTRIYRGGGFTKDHLYLRGLSEMYRFWSDGNDLRPLLIGKTSLEHYGTILEMIERGILKQPKYLSRAIMEPRTEENNPIYDYIIRAIR
ncbi:flavohemoglobin expression-modulating QEGLA motif protein [Sanyastnella coralliicola]|uniref:flavohemoglobin expression-modulating QEGLA motif protein n=1 Tax=Sanyastnella coralliicola TaxID=3069118 RepID=UPI0027BA7232|nr:flavohemoglobin expression-modulating QEGLA motif protein [Longitalea sp. SCSIO 12813]